MLTELAEAALDDPEQLQVQGVGLGLGQYGDGPYGVLYTGCRHEHSQR